MPESVLIADDHPIFRRGLREVIEAHPDYTVIAEAEDGTRALRLIRTNTPDLAILDISMPEADGLDVMAQARRWPDAPRFIILTLYEQEDCFRRAIELGAMGYLLKENAEEELITCMQSVSRGRRYLSPAVSWKLVEGVDRQSVTGPISTLTPTEVRILKLIAEHKTSREIGELLSVSHRTVQNHRNNIARKLDLHGTHALLRFALDQFPEP